MKPTHNPQEPEIKEVKDITHRSLYSRLQVLWSAIKYVFSGKGIWMMGDLRMSVGEPRIAMEAYVRRNDGKWHHWATTFDGKQPIGYVDGTKVGAKP